MKRRVTTAPRRARIFVAVIVAVAAFAGVSFGPAVASVALPALVPDQASTATPAVPGGQCYKKVTDPSACRRV